MLLENRSIAVEENINGFAEHATWAMWERAMLSRNLLNLAGPAIKTKVVNAMFKNSWGKHRGKLEFAERSFNKMWKERSKN